MWRAVSWFDPHIIDGVVNLAASDYGVRRPGCRGLFDQLRSRRAGQSCRQLDAGFGGRLRRLQTGSINGYLYGILAAVMVILIVRAMWQRIADRG